MDGIEEGVEGGKEEAEEGECGDDMRFKATREEGGRGEKGEMGKEAYIGGDGGGELEETRRGL